MASTPRWATRASGKHARRARLTSWAGSSRVPRRESGRVRRPAASGIRRLGVQLPCGLHMWAISRRAAPPAAPRTVPRSTTRHRPGAAWQPWRRTPHPRLAATAPCAGDLPLSSAEGGSAARPLARPMSPRFSKCLWIRAAAASCGNALRTLWRPVSCLAPPQSVLVWLGLLM